MTRLHVRSLGWFAALALILTGAAQAFGQQTDAQKVQAYLQPQESGALVTWVMPRSPADRAGIRSGDVIVKVDNTRIANLRDLWEALRDASGDVKVILTDRRGDSRRTVIVDPNRRGRIGVYAEPYLFSRSGPGQHAVEVTYVHPDSPAAWAGLEPGDIITRVDGQRIDSLRELSKALRDARGGARLQVINVRTGLPVVVYVYPTADDRIGIDAELTTVSFRDHNYWEY